MLDPSQSARRKYTSGVIFHSVISTRGISSMWCLGSGSQKIIQRRLMVMITIETMRIPSMPASCAIVPPMAGPTRKAVQKAAPMSPIFLVFSSGLEMSEIYACTTANPDPPIPATRRARRYPAKPMIPTVLPNWSARSVTIYPRRLNTDVTMRRFFRPYLSERFPTTNHEKNIPMA